MLFEPVISDEEAEKSGRIKLLKQEFMDTTIDSKKISENIIDSFLQKLESNGAEIPFGLCEYIAEISKEGEHPEDAFTRVQNEEKKTNKTLGKKIFKYYSSKIPRKIAKWSSETAINSHNVVFALTREYQKDRSINLTDYFSVIRLLSEIAPEFSVIAPSPFNYLIQNTLTEKGNGSIDLVSFDEVKNPEKGRDIFSKTKPHKPIWNSLCGTIEDFNYEIDREKSFKK